MRAPNKRKRPLRKEKRDRRPRPLYPDYFYRINEGPDYFGYKPTQLRERILAGEIPPPVKLSPDGRAAGWYGRTIIAHQQKIQANASSENAA
jgi:hypothetical protein